MSGIMTVSQLNRYISGRFKDDKKLRGIFVSGEISNFTDHQKTGHLYFTLKDGGSAVKAVMFNSMASRLRFKPAAGMRVIVSANVQVFERDGVYQLYVNEMEPDGIGALYLAVEQLKERLEKEGMFDESIKKPLPMFPEKIAVVTSPDAAALQDMLNIIKRRYPVVNVRIYPCLVQGENAPESISKAIERADKGGNDIIIAGRGGGSLEDLMAFNSEEVVRSIFNCNTPIISAVGHETDTTLADFAADLRAPTPSAAAEQAVPELTTLFAYLNSFKSRLEDSYSDRLMVFKRKLELAENRINMLLPSKKAENYGKLIDEKQARLEMLYKNRIASFEAAIGQRYAALDNLSPLKIMNRGYSLVYDESVIVKSVKDVKKGQKLRIKLSDGEFTAIAEEIIE